MKIKEVAQLTGVSVRTLHHYDAIDLLKPDQLTEAGYRLYSDTNLLRLQQILFFKELGFPLKEIKDILNQPDFDRQDALMLQHQMLLDKQKKLAQMIETIEKTIEAGKGERQMSKEEQFKGFDFKHNPYEEEARKRWGNEAVDQANQNVSKMTATDQDRFNQIFRDLAEVRHLDPASKQAQESIEKWYLHLQSIATYSLEAFKGLGQMYIDDDRFRKNIDQFGDGLALFMRDAMAIYADNHQ